MAYSSPACDLASLFSALARQQAERPALILDDQRVSYGRLDRDRAHLRDHFAAHGLGPRIALGIIHNKRPAAYAAMLAALSLGAPYFVLDPSNPKKRVDAILSQAQPSLLVGDAPVPEPLQAAAQERGLTVLDLQALMAEPPPGLPAKLPQVIGSHPAYFMFTSGSTGIPKGVVISQDNLRPFIAWIKQRFAVTPDDVFTGVNPAYFDNSVFDFYGSLFNGAALAPFSQDVVERPAALVDAVDRRGCTLWFSVPSLLVYLHSMKQLDGRGLTGIRSFIFGGEGFPKSVLKVFFERYGQRADLVNVYGPTECTCICSAYRIQEKDFADLTELAPLGALNEGFEGLVLDGSKPCGPGEVGELCLLGPGVGLGYVNDPERTKAAFCQAPITPNWPERMYRTGDLVCQDTDGLYHFRGRKDHQIKHMGYRIELEEIEAALNAFDQVFQAAVVYHRPDPARPGRILAFVDGPRRDDLPALKSHLADRLPVYMRPRDIYLRSPLPKNANGKVDRHAIGLLATQERPDG